MTMKEAKKKKMLVIKGSFTGVIDLTRLWFKVCIFSDIKISWCGKSYLVSYRGEFDEGMYVLGSIIEAIRQANGECHLEMSCEYE